MMKMTRTLSVLFSTTFLTNGRGRAAEDSATPLPPHASYECFSKKYATERALSPLPGIGFLGRLQVSGAASFGWRRHEDDQARRDYHQGRSLQEPEEATVCFGLGQGWRLHSHGYSSVALALVAAAPTKMTGAELAAVTQARKCACLSSRWSQEATHVLIATPIDPCFLRL